MDAPAARIRLSTVRQRAVENLVERVLKSSGDLGMIPSLARDESRLAWLGNDANRRGGFGHRWQRNAL